MTQACVVHMNMSQQHDHRGHYTSQTAGAASVGPKATEQQRSHGKRKRRETAKEEVRILPFA